MRNKCLQLIGCLGPVEKGVAKEAESQAAKDVQKIIGDHFNDQDPRVRTAAIKAMASSANIVEETAWGSIRKISQKFVAAKIRAMNAQLRILVGVSCF